MKTYNYHNEGGPALNKNLKPLIKASRISENYFFYGS